MNAAAPEPITAPDEQRRCCVMLPYGKRCPNRSEYWVGTQLETAAMWAVKSVVVNDPG